MKSKNGVLVLTGDHDTAAAVARALDGCDRLFTAGVCTNLAELVAELDRQTVAGVVVDIDPHPDRMLADLSPIITQHNDRRFVVLSLNRTDELLLAAMHVGARHFLQKASVEAELPNVLKKLLFNGAAAGSEHGAIVSVLSAGGGCGATTLAVNLASEIQLLTQDSILLVDMDCAYGAVANYLGVKNDYGLADVLTHGTSPDPQLVSSCATVYRDDFHVLLSPASVRFAAHDGLEFGNLQATMEACRSAYAYTVFDAPRVSMEVAAVLARGSRAVLLVMQLSVKDLRIARSMRNFLLERGVLPERIVPIINRYHRRRSMISFEEGRLALGDDLIERVRNDYRSASRSVNYGRPLSDAAPISALRKDVRRLAEQFVMKAAPLPKRKSER